MVEGVKFTPLAARRWAELDVQFQIRLLNNVWCVNCRKTTSIVQYDGRMERGDLILEGFCIKCGGPVARVVEGM